MGLVETDGQRVLRIQIRRKNLKVRVQLIALGATAPGSQAAKQGQVVMNVVGVRSYSQADRGETRLRGAGGGIVEARRASLGARSWRQKIGVGSGGIDGPVV